MVAGRENSGWPPGLEGEAGPGGGASGWIWATEKKG